MQVRTVRFLKSGTSPRHYPPPDLPEIAFAGRSNVGKSSLINALVNRKGLAKTSNTPGRTQVLNFFLVNETLYITDLPGYGYARAPEAVRRSWGPMVETYLRERKNLRAVLLLLDIRREPNDDDLSLWEWLKTYSIPCLVVLTKADKLPRGQVAARRRAVSGLLGLDMGAVTPFSTKTGEGRAELWQGIQRQMANPDPPRGMGEGRP